MPNLKQLWTGSLAFRRITALAVLAAMALLVYLGSHIPRSVSLPDDDLDKLAHAGIVDEQIVIEKPVLAEGDLVLSYVGSRNEVADLWLDNATLVPQSRMLFGGSASPARISYTTGPDTTAKTGAGVTRPDDTCHTTVEIRRSAGSPSVATLRLFQTDETAGAQRFRQIVIDPGSATLDVSVHTDSPVDGDADFPGCHKLLTIGGQQPVQLPLLPVNMQVRSGKIDLHFNPSNPGVPISTGAHDTFLGVSLGSGALQAGGIEVIANARPKPERLNVKPASSSQSVSVKSLKLGADRLAVEIGRDGEKAVAYAGGRSLYNYDLIAMIQKNPILSFIFAAVLVPALWKWVRTNCFPGSKE